jgi:predicted nucleic acid-binding protein
VAAIDTLRGQLVAIDTAPLIYFIEHHPRYYSSVQPFFAAVDRGEIAVVTSTVTLLEVLVHPYRQGNLELMQQYRDILLNARGFRTVAISPAIAEEAARLRAFHRILPADALHLATALIMDASAFLTNDARIPDSPALRIVQVDQL